MPTHNREPVRHIPHKKISRSREYNFSLVCQHCGDIFEASRYDAKFCKARCRSQNHRMQLNRSLKMQRIKEIMHELLRDAPTSEAYEQCLDDVLIAVELARIT